MIESCEKALQVWKEEFDGIYRYGGAFVLTMDSEIIGCPARVLMLEQLIHVRSHDGVWLTTCEEVARYQASQKSSLVSVEV